MRLAADEPLAGRSGWTQLGKFCAVGASGYVVNLAIFSALAHGAGFHYGLAAVCSFLVAVSNNYAWNRLWTFRARSGRVAIQATRFLAVSVAALSLNLAVLTALVAGGLAELPAQAAAILAVAPASFLANRTWTFRGTRRARPSVLALVEREPYLLPLVAIYVVALARLAPFELVQDSWLTFVSGREVANGLPQTDGLTVFGEGARWVDQQWLAQLAFYGLASAGGTKAALMAHIALLAAALCVALAAARRLGASGRSAFWTGVAFLFLAPWTLQLRSQSFAYLLFVAILWLLARDSRNPSRQVFFVLPLLVLWANLHGSVLLGAGLVALRGVTAGLRPRSAALVGLAPLCVLASPYAPSLLGYYHHLLLGPVAGAVREWQPPTFSQAWPFFLLALAAVWLLARSGSRLTLFERLALLATVLAGFLAIRNITWFALAWAVLAPVALEAVLPAQRSRRPGRPLRLLAGTAVLAIPATVVVMASWPAKGYESRWPEPALRAVSGVTDADPSARVFASERYADWLLWRKPELAGRVAFDVRFELYRGDQLEAIVRFKNRIGDDWRAAAAGYDVVVLDRLADRELEAPLLDSPGARRLYGDELVSVLYRPSG